MTESERGRESVRAGLSGDKGRAGSAQRLAWILAQQLSSHEEIERTVLDAISRGCVRALCVEYERRTS